LTACGRNTGDGIVPESKTSGPRPKPVPRVAITLHIDEHEGSTLRMPEPRAAIRHAIPLVIEGVLGPLALFYVVLVLAGFRGALIAALGWSYLALGRRLYKGERVSMLLLFGIILITLRTTIALVTGSAFAFFAQPTAGTFVISLVLFASAILGRPFTQRFALDFCPIDPEIMERPLVRRFFIRISVLWATVLMLNAGLVLWLLLSTSLRSFVIERSVVTYGLTATAIFFSITRFVAMMRHDNIRVEWARAGPRSR
jgi:hypothetical protein